MLSSTRGLRRALCNNLNHRAIRSVAATENYVGNKTLGIVREEYGMWERRAPLAPAQVQEMVKNNGIKVLIQPCNRRIFSNSEYEKAGAVVTEDLSSASMIIGVKKVHESKIVPGMSYMFFSHVIKAQPANMKLLDTILEKKARLFDYECITAEGRDDTLRLVAFGKYAGTAGMIDGLQGLGVRLLSAGFSNPFLNVPLSYMHEDLAAAKSCLQQVGKQIEGGALSPQLSPLVFAFTGTGNVSQGAREMFDLLPHEYVTMAELESLEADVRSGKRSNRKLYGIVISEAEMVRKVTGEALTDRFHYYAHPQQYVAQFHDKVLPYVSVIMNGTYWDQKYPRLITKQQMKDLRKTGNKKLLFVADISCDVGGSIEFLSHSTTIEKPFYSYNPESDSDTDDVLQNGIMMLGVDILPSELPRDATQHFGNALLPLLPPILKSSGCDKQEDIVNLPPELRRACIASHGTLLPKWQYIARLREQSNVLSSSSSSMPTVVNVELRGHLFDSGLINQVLDLTESLSVADGVSFSVVNCDVRPNLSSGAVPSKVLLQLSGDDAKVKGVAKRIQDLVNAHPSAEASTEVKTTASTVDVKMMSRKRVLMFGSGRVAKPVMRLFGEQEDVHVTIASDDQGQAQDLQSVIPDTTRTAFTSFKFPQDISRLDAMIKDCDVVISLLPATMHTPLAEAAIRQRRHLVTASYVSPAMKALDAQAKAAGIILLNEAGLDPGIDHMLIMKSVDDIHMRGGEVQELVSLCGGLPDPVAADNPLRYKISWSPRGMLAAAGNDAQYLQHGKVIKVAGEDLLKSASVSGRFPTIRMEVLPNRDSLTYSELYGVPSAHSICRGTLRYEGWANNMYGLKALGLFDTNKTSHKTWHSLLHETAKGNSGSSLRAAMKAKGVVDVESAVEAAQWLGVDTDRPLGADTPIDSLCKLLEEKLLYKEGEKDMVAMFHTIVGRMPDGSHEHHTSRLLAFGNPGGDSAMSATVGYTTAAAAELVLRGGMKHRSGVIIPVSADVYEPMLKRLQNFGVTWTESITVEKK